MGIWRRIVAEVTREIHLLNVWAVAWLCVGVAIGGYAIYAQKPSYKSYKPGVISVSMVDPGGNVATYIQWWERVRDSGDFVRIDGECISACTLVMGIVPRERICITDRASFGIHQASNELGMADKDGTERLIRLFYPKIVRDWVDAHRPFTLDVQYMYPEDLKGYYETCPA